MTHAPFHRPRRPSTVYRCKRSGFAAITRALIIGSALGGAITAVAATTAVGSVTRDAASGIDWVVLEGFSIARTETTIGQFRRFAAATGTVTQAEREGGGSVYEAGWTQKRGWVWSTPYGPQYRAGDDEPAAHVAYDEAQAFCRWAGGQLPTDSQWKAAAYREQRPSPPGPFLTGRTYPFPTGDSPAGAQCLDDCGPQSARRSVQHGAALSRGLGHAPAGQTAAGVNGLHDMGANLWEWVDDPPGQRGNAERLTRGGSWWYGSGPMREEHRQSKPGNTTVVYIGFRCVKPSR
ncbi:MAG: formylglycine-generating enzyme family protein [Betaproteobacteria bacterium]|nr:formylglycine-generating enzyme family protein [Betaproteobacteria bacterium]